MTIFHFPNKSKPKFDNQEKLNALSNLIVDDLENIFRYFEVDLKHIGNKWVGGCPVHQGGSDKNPFNLYIEGDFIRGNWKCRSHQCETVFKKSPIGLIRGLLSAKTHNWQTKGDKTVSFDEAVNWCLKWTQQDYSAIEVSVIDEEKKRFAAQKWSSENKETGLKLSREQVQSILTVPSSYFQSRGYLEKVLRENLVGDCDRPGKEMSGRAVVPIFDNDGKFIIGCTGRSVYEQCDKCKMWHRPDVECPHNDLEQYLCVKWRHNKGFRAEEHLYNLWAAKANIEKTYAVTLVESPGNTWKCIENNVLNSVATFGAHLTNPQHERIIKTPALMVNLILDNDKAGEIAREDIVQKLNKTHSLNIVHVPNEYNDISEMPNSEFQRLIIPQIKSYSI